MREYCYRCVMIDKTIYSGIGAIASAEGNIAVPCYTSVRTSNQTPHVVAWDADTGRYCVFRRIKTGYQRIYTGL